MILSYRKYFKSILKDNDFNCEMTNSLSQGIIGLVQLLFLTVALAASKVIFLYLLLSFIISKIVFGLINVFLFKDLFVLNDKIKNKSISPIISGDLFFIGYLIYLIIGSLVKLIIKCYNFVQNLVFKEKKEKIELETDPETYRT